jgi:hypothetical protein
MEDCSVQCWGQKFCARYCRIYCVYVKISKIVCYVGGGLVIFIFYLSTKRPAQHEVIKPKRTYQTTIPPPENPSHHQISSQNQTTTSNQRIPGNGLADKLAKMGTEPTNTLCEHMHEDMDVYVYPVVKIKNKYIGYSIGICDSLFE